MIVFKHLLTDRIWYHHTRGDGLQSLSMPFIWLCHLLLTGQFAWSQSLFSDKFKEYLCNGAHQEWRPSITGLIFLLTLHHLLVLPSTTHLLSTFPTHLFTFFRKYLKSSTHPNQPSTFTSPLLAHPKIILKVVHYTTSFGNLVKIFWTILSDGGISFSPKPFGFMQWSCNSHKITLNIQNRMPFRCCDWSMKNHENITNLVNPKSSPLG